MPILLKTTGSIWVNQASYLICVFQYSNMQMRCYVMSFDCIHYTSTDDLCSEAPAVLTIELIAFNQSTSEGIMETQNVTSLVINK